MQTLTRNSQGQEVSSGQLEQTSRVVMDAGRKAVEELLPVYGKDGAQRIHKNGDRLAKAVHDAIDVALCELSRFEESFIAVHDGQERVDRQIEVLQKYFPGLARPKQSIIAQVDKAKSAAVKGTVGPFAVLNIWRPEVFGGTYVAAFRTVIGILNPSCDSVFANLRDGRVLDGRLRQFVATQDIWRKMSKSQGDPDILVFLARFAPHPSGNRVRRALGVFNGDEFSLGAFPVSIMLLTHQSRPFDVELRYVLCAGDQVDTSFSFVGKFEHSPCLGFIGNKLELRPWIV